MRTSNHAWVIVLAILAGCASALAAAPEPDPARQARAQAIVDETPNGAAAFRANALGAIVHIQSGMTCLLGNDAWPLARLVVTPNVPAGDDVGCDYAARDGKITAFATRLGAQPFDGYVAGVIAAIKQVYPSAGAPEAVMILTEPGISKPHAVGFPVTIDGKRYMTSVWLAEENGWAIEVRATYPAEPRHDPESIAAGMTLLAQKTIHAKP